LLALATGRATITAELGDKSAQLAVLVSPAPIERLAIVLDRTTAVVGDSLKVHVDAVDRNAQQVTPRLRWSVEPAESASITSDGVVFVLLPGIITVRATLAPPADDVGLTGATPTLSATATFESRPAAAVAPSLVALSVTEPAAAAVDAVDAAVPAARGRRRVAAAGVGVLLVATVGIMVARRGSTSADDNATPRPHSVAASAPTSAVGAAPTDIASPTASSLRASTPTDSLSASARGASKTAPNSGATRGSKIGAGPTTRVVPPAPNVPSSVPSTGSSNAPSSRASNSPVVAGAQASAAASAAPVSGNATAPTPAAVYPPTSAPPTAPTNAPTSAPANNSITPRSGGENAATGSGAESLTAADLKSAADRIVGEMKSGSRRPTSDLKAFFADGDAHKAVLLSAPLKLSEESGRVRAQFDVRLSRFNAGGLPENMITTVTADIVRRSGTADVQSVSFSPLVKSKTR
jgi:hypothetical protein